MIHFSGSELYSLCELRKNLFVSNRKRFIRMAVITKMYAIYFSFVQITDYGRFQFTIKPPRTDMSYLPYLPRLWKLGVILCECPFTKITIIISIDVFFLFWLQLEICFGKTQHPKGRTKISITRSTSEILVFLILYHCLLATLANSTTVLHGVGI